MVHAMKDMNAKTSRIRTVLTIVMLALTALLPIAGCASNAGTVPVADATSDYVLGIGDALRITVYGQDGLTGEYKVDARGAVSFPLINDVHAAGYTTTELEQTIAAKLDPDYIVDPRVNVEVLNYRAIYVLGEVQSPGRYEFSPNMTVMQAIASAGGHTYRANEDSVELTRHVKGALKTFTIDQKTMIKPGDTIVVKRRWF